jgi:hypothetical protein
MPEVNYKKTMHCTGIASMAKAAEVRNQRDIGGRPNFGIGDFPMPPQCLIPEVFQLGAKTVPALR